MIAEGQNSYPKWDYFNNSALEIGLSLFAPNQEFVEYSRLPEDTLFDDAKPDFRLREDWARQRSKDWMEKVNQPQSSSIIVYSENRNLNDINGFILLSIKSDVQMNVRPLDDGTCKMMIHVNDSSCVLHNVHWREFMSGRPGRYIEHDTYTFSTSKEKVKAFLAALDAYRKWYGHQN